MFHLLFQLHSSFFTIVTKCSPLLTAVCFISVSLSLHSPSMYLFGGEQFLIQLVFSILILALWRPMLILQVVAVLLILSSSFIACMYVMLFTFHVYLTVRGLSTYDYTIEQSKKYKKTTTTSSSNKPNKSTPVSNNKVGATGTVATENELIATNAKGADVV
jgi:hypothetical protein